MGSSLHTKTPARAVGNHAPHDHTGVHAKLHTTRHQIVDGLFVLSVALSPLALGGTHPAASFGLCVWFVLLTLWSYGLHLRHRQAWRTHWPIMGLLLLIAWAAVRMWTGTRGLAPAITQHAWALWPDLHASSALAPGRIPLWIARTLTFAAVATYAALRFSRSDQIRPALLAIVGAGTTTMLAGLVQSLLKADAILGVYRPIDWDRVVPLAGPFVNPNQAGAIAGLAAIAAIGLAILVRSAPARAGLILLGTALAAYTGAVQANGAILALLLAALSGSLIFATRRVARERVAALLTGWLVIITTLCAAFLYLIAPALQFFATPTLHQKTTIWNAALTVPLKAPLVGFGPGGFQEAFATLGLNRNHVWVSDPESGPIQLFSEHGLILATIVCAAIAIVAYRTMRLRSSTSPTVVHILCALGAFVLVEAITGLGLHASAYLAAAGIVFGIGAGRSARKKARAELVPTRFVQPALVAAMAAFVILLAPKGIEASLNDSRPPLPPEARGTLQYPDEWIQVLDRRAQQAPASPPVIAQRAWMESALGHHARALALAAGLRRHAPNYPKWNADATVIALYASDHELACRWMREDAERFRALQENAIETALVKNIDFTQCLDSPDLQSVVYRALRGIGRHELASTIAFQLANSPNPTNEARRLAIDAAIYLKPAEIAALWVEDLVAARPTDPAVFETLFQWATAANASVAQRLPIALAAIEADRDNPRYQLFYANTLLQSEDDAQWYAKARQALQHAQAQPQRDARLTLRIRKALADAAWKAQAWEDAQPAYEGLLRQSQRPTQERPALTNEERVTAYYRLGEIARAKGDYFTAQRHYREALDINPRHEPSLTALAALGG